MRLIGIDYLGAQMPTASLKHYRGRLSEAFMGGYGSGWQGAKKATVEGSLVLTAASLVRKRALMAGAWTSGSWGWTYDGEDKPHATIGYEADLSDQDNAWLRLHYRGTESRWTTGSGS